MCGIVGVLKRDRDEGIDQNALYAAATAIAHRGPDAEGFWIAPGVGLAHRRLSIIDVDGGDQPIQNEDGSIQVVFNGELYNYRQLRSQLESRGHRFYTKTDTEVLVHLYEEQGDELVHSLRGMFAFGLWDAHKQRMLLARDRLGLKPLYYYQDSKTLLFASEIKPLLVFPEPPQTVDVEGLEDYLAFGVIPGERTIFRSIRKLPPGHILSVSRNVFQASPRRYWQLETLPDESQSVDEWKEAVREKFQETVTAHRIADVPVGAFLSGGLDSSAVAGALVESGASSLHTFSIGFDDERYSELPYARLVARQFGTRHVEAIVTPQAVDSLDDLVRHFDEPFADASAIPTMQVARLAREHVKVVLSGDGGDEAFGGYARYAHDLREALWRRRVPGVLQRRLLRPLSSVWPKADWLPRPLRLKSALMNLSLDAPEAYANTVSLCRRPLRRRLLHSDLHAELNGNRPELCVINGFGSAIDDPLRGMISADVNMLLPDDFLTKVDRASMAVGLEVRPPLVDHEFLELTARMPSSLKVRSGETKWLFKQICDGWLPHDVVRRPKQGFDVPIDQWLRGPLRDLFQECVLRPQTPIAPYINQDLARHLFDAHCRRTGRHGALLWALIVLGHWMSHYLSGHIGRTPTLSG